MQARSASISIQYDNKDISEDLAVYLKSFDYNDVMDGEADDISLTLEDMAELWEGDWLPEKGALLTVGIITNNWKKNGKEKLDIGLFEVDEIELTGLPHEVKIKAVSVPDNNTLRGIERNRSWEKTKLSVIAKDIADNAGMELFYDVPDDPELERAEQTEESDLSFLQRICKDAGFSLKVTDNKLVIFDVVTYEAREPVGTVEREEADLLSYNIRSKTRDVYKSCHVKYANTKSGETIEYTFTPDDKKKGKVLEVNEQVENIAAAEKLAKKKLREKNCEEVTIGLSCVGSSMMLAGNTVIFHGFHAFDGKYIITKCSHSIGNGYTMNVDFRRCLDGY